jgi:hypothetical protein
MFVGLAVLPLIVVFYFSIQFINRGIDSWFNVQVEEGLENALTLSRAAIEIRKRQNLFATTQVANRLAVIPDRNHGDIIKPLDPGASKQDGMRAQLGQLILEALGATPASYDRMATRWRDEVCMATRRFAGTDDSDRKRLFGRDFPSRECFHEYFQLVVRVEDEFGEPIPDYFLTFTGKPKSGLLSFIRPTKKSVAFFHNSVLEATHTYRPGHENRCFFLDRYDMMRPGGFYDQIEADQEKELSFTVTAADPGEHIAYFARDPKARGVVPVHRKGQGNRWLKRHSTHFVKVIVPRAGRPDIFQLKRG